MGLRKNSIDTWPPPRKNICVSGSVLLCKKFIFLSKVLHNMVHGIRKNSIGNRPPSKKIKKNSDYSTTMVHGTYNFNWYSTFNEKRNIFVAGSAIGTILRIGKYWSATNLHRVSFKFLARGKWCVGIEKAVKSQWKAFGKAKVRPVFLNGLLKYWNHNFDVLILKWALKVLKS